MSEPRHSDVHLAPDVVPERPLAAVGVALILFSLLLVGVAALLLGAFREDAGAPPPPAAPPAIAPERLEGIFQTPLPGDAGLRMQRDQATALERWGWADRERGLVRLPLGLAVERLLAGEGPVGLPAAGPAAVAPSPLDAGTDPAGETGRNRGGREDAPASIQGGGP
jgi:hypothetical protein